MASNKLVLNSDKTHLLVMATPYQHYQNGDYGIYLNTGDEVIQPIRSEKLLGGQISNDFTFNEHLKENEMSVFRSLTSRVNALAKVSQISSFKTRKMIADGVVISKLLYLIQWWGGTHKYLINFLQILQNRAARLVTSLRWDTPIAVLLTQCGWLSVNQMVHFHSLTLVYKMKQEKTPKYFQSKFDSSFPYDTRLSAEAGIRRTETYNREVTKTSFVPRTATLWNTLPPNIRTASTLKIFKDKLKPWVQKTLPI
jgi:hypothetical protein